MKRYNGSKFHIRNKYKDIFKGLSDEPDNDDEDAKIYKIGYVLNLLPNIDE